ncbi:ribose-phosphate diphosphokinase [Croceibacterium aestuarii]|uniref:ribose-phosphate diphosphokinase n=1 Tax=Croceibacterium aestuarii TaxID=3064139 RepID=UPI00272E1439|nr:ribose-phosphate diphosphokinase [Croceibacterium sp. D39]
MACALFGFPESGELAARLAGELGVSSGAVALHRFPDGESLVRVDPPPETVILYRSLDHPNAKLVELLLAASALRQNGARRLILVAPYLCYMRQDKAFEPGQAVSQRVVGALLAAHFDALLTVDPHLHRIRSLEEIMPGTEAVSVTAAPVLSSAIDAGDNPVLVGPDGESRQWVEAIAAPLGLSAIVGTKRRDADREVEISFERADEVAGRGVVLIDDVISSGATLEQAARLLRKAGATRVEALATHCLASAAEIDLLKQAGIDRIRSTDSVAGPTATITLVKLLADEIRKRGWSN